MMKKALSLLLALGGTFSGAFTAAHAQDAKIEAKVAQCIGCHGIPGYQASFPEVHKVPMISGQSAKYIEAALQAYRKGDRKHPTMRGIAASLSDKDIAELAAYYADHGRNDGATAAPVPDAPAAPAANVAALLTKGACASCHGANFSKGIDPSYPKIAGQYSDYLYVALKSYRQEGSGPIGRNNAIMGAQVKQFSNAELKAIADYIGALPAELRTQPQSRWR